MSSLGIFDFVRALSPLYLTVDFNYNLYKTVSVFYPAVQDSMLIGDTSERTQPRSHRA